MELPQPRPFGAEGTSSSSQIKIKLGLILHFNCPRTNQFESVAICFPRENRFNFLKLQQFNNHMELNNDKNLESPKQIELTESILNVLEQEANQRMTSSHCTPIQVHS